LQQAESTVVMKDSPDVSKKTGEDGSGNGKHATTVHGTYSHEEVSAATLEFFDGDELAADTWVSKYALRDGDGRYVEKTPPDMHCRLAREFARIEKSYENPMSEEEIFGLLSDWTVVAQGSPMSGVGNPFQLQSVSNCFGISPPFDSYGGILLTDQQQAQIMKRRGGVGTDISTLRPKGMPTANAAHTTDGLGIFMERFSHTCGEVGQGGRRGALMLTCDVHHPEIRRFIGIKDERSSCRVCGHEERTRVTKANVSVRLSDEFLEAVEKGEKYQMRWPCDPDQKPVLEEWTDAQEIWDDINQHARDSAEPGLLFWDRILRESPADCYADVGFRTITTNPCSEIPLSGADACRLLLVNLAKFVKDPFTDKATFEWARLHEVTKKAQRLMDDLVDIELEQVDKIIAKIEADPEPPEVKTVELGLWRKIRASGHNGRRTGLGVTAVGDTIAMLGHKYGSDESIDLVEKIYRALAVASYESSIEMAGERGCFPVYNYKKEEGHPFIERVLEAGGEELRTKYERHGRRNIANLTTAPTGSVSLLTQTSSGIEPIYRAIYTRRKKINSGDPDARIDYVDASGEAWSEYTVRHHGLVRWEQVTGKGDEDFEESPYHGAEAHDLDWNQRVRFQAAATRWLDHAVSSTINLPEDVSVDTVKQIHWMAWKSGCKGITTYRENSRDGVLVEKREFLQHSAPKRPERLPCDIHRSRVKREDGEYEDWIIFVGLFEGKPYEVFGGTTENIELPKKVTEGHIVKRALRSGGKYDLHYGEADDPLKIKDIVRQFDNADRGWATRMISLALRHGSPPQYMVEQLQHDKDSDLYDFAKAVARVLKKYIQDGTKSGKKICPKCEAHDSLRYQEGCLLCISCGYSKCM